MHFWGLVILTWRYCSTSTALPHLFHHQTAPKGGRIQKFQQKKTNAKKKHHRSWSYFFVGLMYTVNPKNPNICPKTTQKFQCPISKSPISPWSHQGQKGPGHVLDWWRELVAPANPGTRWVGKLHHLRLLMNRIYIPTFGEIPHEVG